MTLTGEMKKCLLCGSRYMMYCEHCDRPCKKKWCGTCKNIESATKSARKEKS